MASRQLSRRALGKLIDPSNPERGRRQVLRHLSGKHAPSVPSRIKYAQAFGLPGDTFLDSEEEDDEMSVPDLLRDLHRAQLRLAAKIELVTRAVSA